MANNKKTNKSKKGGNSTDKDANNTPNPEAPKPGFTPAQLTAIIYMSIGFTYLNEFKNAVKDGASSYVCGKYVANLEKCTESDLPFLTLKYHSTVLLAGLATGVILLCWNNTLLLQRFNVIMCANPVGSILVASLRQAFRGRVLGDWLLRPGRVLHLCTVAAMVLTLSMNSALRTGFAQIRRPMRLFDFQGISMAIFSSLLLWSVSVATLDGAEGVVNETVASAATEHGRLLLVFYIIDRVAVALISVFIILYPDDGTKRKSMFLLSLSVLYYLYYQYPLERKFIVEAGKTWDAAAASAAAVAAASLLPEMGITKRIMGLKRE